MLTSRQDGERRGLVLLVPRPLQRHLPSLSTCQLLQPRPSQLAQVLMIMKQVLIIIKQVLMNHDYEMPIDQKYFQGMAQSACLTRLADSQIRGESSLQHGTLSEISNFA